MLEISKVQLLPIWCITNKYPAFYDVDSANAIEQTARLYGAMRELQEKYNEFATASNKVITDFINSVNADQECFKNEITKLIHDYIDYMDTKYAEQDKEIQEAITYMKENLSSSISSIIAEMKEMGELDEAVLNAIDGIGTRVATLETNSGEHASAIEDLNTRVISLENTKVKLIYNESEESIDFENVIIEEGL